MSKITVGGIFPKAKSLSEAIEKSSFGDTIVIRGSIKIEQQVEIKHDLYIEGTEKTVIKIQPHIIGIQSSAHLHLKDLTFISSKQSVAVATNNNISLTNVTFQHQKKIIQRELYPSLSIKNQETSIIDSRIDVANLNVEQLSITDTQLGSNLPLTSSVNFKEISTGNCMFENIELIGANDINFGNRVTFKPGVIINGGSNTKLYARNAVFVNPYETVTKYQVTLNEISFSEFEQITIETPQIAMFNLINSGITIIDSKYPRQTQKSNATGSTIAFRNTVDTTEWNLVNTKTSSVDASKNGSETIKELDAMIGLSSVKEHIKKIITTTQMNAERVANGISANTGSALHMSFEGNAGTGKTTVAKLFGRALYENGVLPTDKFVIAKKADLVGEHIGETPIKARNKVTEALGGILFIDEAYELAVHKDGQGFESEAITTILDMMEENRDNLVVIVAGYEEDMQRFYDSNQGLTSRFPTHILFPNYSVNELIEIFIGNVRKSEQSFADVETLQLIGDTIQYAVTTQQANGNGRFIRNMYEAILAYRDVRISQLETRTKADFTTLNYTDVEQYLTNDLQAKNQPN